MNVTIVDVRAHPSREDFLLLEAVFSTTALGPIYRGSVPIDRKTLQGLMPFTPETQAILIRKVALAAETAVKQALARAQRAVKFEDLRMSLIGLSDTVTTPTP